MKNIYINPESKPTKDVDALANYLKELLSDETLKGKTIRTGGVFPYIQVSKEMDSIVVSMDAFYGVHYLFSLDPTDPTTLVTCDILKYGEKTLADVLEDVKTTVKYVLANQTEVEEDE